MLECVFDNNHCIGERREMSTQSLPAASLRTGNRLPAGRVLLQVSKYLVWMALSSIYSSIRGAVSIFLPEAGRPGVPRLGLGAAASGRVVGVLALAQHHPDGVPGRSKPRRSAKRGLREQHGHAVAAEARYELPTARPPSAPLLARMSDEEMSKRKRCSGISVKRSA
jgi:hypothetical protein